MAGVQPPLRRTVAVPSATSMIKSCSSSSSWSCAPVPGPPPRLLSTSSRAAETHTLGSRSTSSRSYSCSSTTTSGIMSYHRAAAAEVRTGDCTSTSSSSTATARAMIFFKKPLLTATAPGSGCALFSPSTASAASASTVGRHASRETTFPLNLSSTWRQKRFFSVEEFWRGGLGDPETDFNQKAEMSESGDPWPACLLRLKSFEDLHKLWYVCLKEKNFLLGERQFVRQASNTPNMWRNHGRLKKVKLTMKRILTVLSRREIHEQALRAKEIRGNQVVREQLETRRFHLEEEQKLLEAKIKRMGNDESVSKQAWRATIEKNEQELEELHERLVPLRKATMALLIPDWRYSRKYTDLPGTITWKKQWIRALDESRKLPFRFY
ncbi:unnamed protein product [Amoebophrya sp. A120]|nr:unnamed protein product [Amoebophrya sp. A120]|eukprot:GSA120T00020809001.1